MDYKVVSNNPIGSCHRRLLAGLCREYEFTVFAVEFENPCPERIRFVRVPVPTRPLALLFVAYHLVAPIVYWLHRLRTGARFDLVQMVESNLSFGRVSYVHFCHRAYLRRHWKAVGARGLRGWLRRLDHWLHALMEPWVYRRVKHLVVPSQGLKRELEETYPFVQGKVTVIPNPVDLERMRPPEGFAREDFRRAHGVGPEEVVLVFVALGHFERKGLPLVLEALKELKSSPVRLWVVGGEADLVRVWRKRVEEMGLGERVSFFGMQQEVRPFLWAADVFVFPSAYEVFPLVSLEAAAAGLPLIVTPLYGVEEFMRDGETGFVVERSVKGVAEGLRRFISLSPESRRRMGEHAREAVAPYGVEPFVEAWRGFYGAGV
jgi:glycosyltransferase involved in cell wall biosynthesis